MWRFFYDAADTVNADAWCRTAIMNRNRWKTQQRRLTRKSIWRGKKCCMPSSVSYIIRPLRSAQVHFQTFVVLTSIKFTFTSKTQFGKPFQAQPGQKDYRMTTPFQIQYLTPSVAPLQDWATIVFVRQGELNLIDWLGSKLPDSSCPGQWLSLARYCVHSSWLIDLAQNFLTLRVLDSDSVLLDTVQSSWLIELAQNCQTLLSWTVTQSSQVLCAQFLIDWLGSKIPDSFVLDSYPVLPGTVCRVLDWFCELKIARFWTFRTPIGTSFYKFLKVFY